MQFLDALAVLADGKRGAVDDRRVLRVRPQTSCARCAAAVASSRVWARQKE